MNPQAISQFSLQRYRLVPLVFSGAEFDGFDPYVPAMAGDGSVVFQARERSGGSGVFRLGGSQRFEQLWDSQRLMGEVVSHPAVNDRGDVCFFVEQADGGVVAWVGSGGEGQIIAAGAGPLGPTMNTVGHVAFRARGADGSERLLVWDGRGVKVIAATGERYAGFQGLAVINASGDVAFRASVRGGGEGLFIRVGTQTMQVLATAGEVEELGKFGSFNDAGVAVVWATRRGSRAAVYLCRVGAEPYVVEAGAMFESLRTVLLTNSGRMVFCATPIGGHLGIYSGPDVVRHRILGTGDLIDGSRVEEFALNQVSINERTQLAIRVRLADGRQGVVRADPC